MSIVVEMIWSSDWLFQSFIVLGKNEFRNISELGAKTVQVPPEILGRNGEPVGKMINQAIYYVANNDVKSARNCMKSLGYSGLQAKIFCKDEIQLQKRHPEEVAKYKGKPMPEEFKLLIERLN